MRKLFVYLLSVFIICLAICPAFAQDNEAKRALLTNFLTNYKTNHQTAYEAAKEYLKQYPNDDDENVRYMKKWIIAFEKVQAGNTTSTPVSNTVSSGSRITAEQHNSIGDQRAKLQEWTEAEAAFREAIKLEPINALYRANLGAALEKQKKYAEAETELREAIKLAPANAQFRAALGTVYEVQGKTAEAETEFKKVSTLVPESEAEFNNLIETLKKYNRWSEVIQLLTPKATEIKTKLIQISDVNNNTKPFSAIENELIRLRTNYISLNLQISEAYEKLNKFEEAKDYYVQYLLNGYFNNQDGDYKNAQNGLLKLTSNLLANPITENNILGQWNCFDSLKEKSIGTLGFEAKGKLKVAAGAYSPSSKYIWQLQPDGKTIKTYYDKNWKEGLVDMEGVIVSSNEIAFNFVRTKHNPKNFNMINLICKK